MSRMIFAALLLLFFVAAQSESAESKLESWYTYWGIGAVNISHPEELADILDLIEDFPGVSRTAISMDLLGFYWPLQDRYLLGGVINGFGDRIESDSEGLTINGHNVWIKPSILSTTTYRTGLFHSLRYWTCSYGCHLR